MTNFDEFRRLVMADSRIRESLLNCPSEEALFAAVVAHGREHGFDFSSPQLVEIARANRKTWLQRWLPS